MASKRQYEHFHNRSYPPFTSPIDCSACGGYGEFRTIGTACDPCTQCGGRGEVEDDDEGEYECQKHN